MSNLKKYLIIAGIIISLIILIIGLIISGKNEAILAQFIAKKQKLKSITDSNNDKIKELNKEADIQKQNIQKVDDAIEVQNNSLADLKKQEHELKNTKIEPMVTPTQSDDILKALQELKK